MKKLLLALMLCTSGAHAAVVVTHAYGVARLVVVTAAPVVHPVAAVAVGVGFIATTSVRTPAMKSIICRTKELTLIINTPLNLWVENK
ncbi:conserved exported hypothetical protein [Serratia proteamaculans]|nr:hypothetical protein [Serratia proteamaculans]SMB35003.1 conserved exported hypothetical protein [Serratia proteamaculans]